MLKSLARREEPSKSEHLTIPSIAEISPEYAELVRRQSSLIEKRGAIKLELERAERALRDLPIAQRQTRVAKLLSFGEDQPTSASQEQIDDLRSELTAIEQAIPLVQKQIDKAHLDASAAICDRVRGEHHKRAHSIGTALLQVHNAMEHYQELADALNARDVAWAHLTPAQPLLLGHPNDPYSRLALVLRNLAEAGFLNRDEIPESVRWG